MAKQALDAGYPPLQLSTLEGCIFLSMEINNIVLINNKIGSINKNKNLRELSR
tara:strand:- start:49 stop:207 length:159 start_codon:yes stop_codon:yes gene_type:complete